MLQRLRHRAQGQEGFTLIELLVVILIIGILAGVAIPVFLNQTGKANDANIKSDINSAATAEETYYTDNQTYVSASTAVASTNPLLNINPALTNAFTSTSATPAGESMTITATSTGYTITATDTKYISFTYTKSATGSVTRTCSVGVGATSTGGCAGATVPASNGTASSGTW